MQGVPRVRTPIPKTAGRSTFMPGSSPPSRGPRGCLGLLSRPRHEGEELVVDVVAVIEAAAEAHHPLDLPALVEVDDRGRAADPERRHGPRRLGAVHLGALAPAGG